MENVKAVETLSNIERRLDGIVAAGNSSREDDGIRRNSMFTLVCSSKNCAAKGKRYEMPRSAKK